VTCLLVFLDAAEALYRHAINRVGIVVTKLHHDEPGTLIASPDDQHSEVEAQKYFEAARRSALKTHKSPSEKRRFLPKKKKTPRKRGQQDQAYARASPY